eukprot:m.182409 g.182409  ORF g.182409 m.182409 type:complete len:318 (+) comp15520_c0_seq1:286-1239(+)
MASFDKTPRLKGDLLPHHGPKLATTEILSHDKPECRFHPELPPDGWRDKIESGSYGAKYVPPGPKKTPEPSRKELRASFKPHTNVSKVSEILKQAVPSNGYGKSKKETAAPIKQKKTREDIRPTPTFRPKINRAKIDVPSSGYGSAGYKARAPPRGEAALKSHSRRNYSHQPEVHIGKTAKELAKQIKPKYASQTTSSSQRNGPTRVLSSKSYSTHDTSMASVHAYRPSTAPDFESYDSGGFILDSVAYAKKNNSVGFSSDGYRGAHLDVDLYAPSVTSKHKQASPKSRPKTTEYDMNGRPKGEPIFDPATITTHNQ